MAWIVGGAMIGSAVLGGLSSNKAASKAADAQTQSAEQAIAEQRRQYDTTRTDQAPYRATGSLALDKLNAGISGGGVDAMAAKIMRAFPTWTATGSQANPGTSQEIVDSFLRHAPQIVEQGGEAFGYKGYDQVAKDLLQEMHGGAGGILAMPDLLRRFNASDLQADPVYQSGLKFGLDRGAGEINARAIAGGGYDSGATIKALTRYANDYGSTKANESYNRYNQDQSNIFNRLSGVAGTGQTATQQVGAAGQNMANQVSNLDTSAGAARSAGIVGGANAWNSALGGAAKGLQYGMWGNPYQRPGTGTATPGSSLPGPYEYGSGYDPSAYEMR